MYNRDERNEIRCGNGMNLSQTCKLLGLNYNAVYSRIRRGATIEQALDMPSLEQEKEEEKKLRKICQERKVPYDIVRTRIQNLGWDLEKALSTEIHNGAVPNHFVIYNGEKTSLNEAIRKFLKDNDLTLTTGSNSVTTLMKKSNIDVQTAFDSYCEKILKKYRREK